jgi:hypothetical protein
MTSPYISARLADQHIHDMRQQADEYRLGRLAREQRSSARPTRTRTRTRTRGWSVIPLSSSRRHAFA